MDVRNRESKLSNWAKQWQMKLRADKCKVMHVGSSNLNYSSTWVGSELVLNLRGKIEAHGRHLNEDVCMMLSRVLKRERKSKYTVKLL